MPSSKKDNLVVLAGIALIILVGFVTFSRPYWKKENTKSTQSEGGSLSQEFPRISAKDLQNKLKNKENITVIDIRTADDFNLEHIIDSSNIPSDVLKNGKLNLDSEKNIAILGNTIEEADAAAVLISEKGFGNIFVLAGGLSAWKNNDGGTINWGDPTSFANQAKIIYITTEEAKKSIDDDKNYLFLDVRNSSDFSPHIPGALNIPLDNLEKKRDELTSSRFIVVYGNAEMEGFMAGVRLYDLGFSSVSVLRGGFSNWKEKRYPTE
jgi:rhodanese-related sulfurtransferase